MKLYESEKVLLPLTIHENYLKKVLNKSTTPFNDTLRNIVKISGTVRKVKTKYLLTSSK